MKSVPPAIFNRDNRFFDKARLLLKTAESDRILREQQNNVKIIDNIIPLRDSKVI